jgi:hypothetical protein
MTASILASNLQFLLFCSRFHRGTGASYDQVDAPSQTKISSFELLGVALDKHSNYQRPMDFGREIICSAVLNVREQFKRPAERRVRGDEGYNI